MQQLVVKVSARSWSVLLSWLKHVLQVMSKAPSSFYTHISATLTTQPSYTPLHPSSTPLPTHVSTLYSFPSFQCRLSFLYRESPPPKSSNSYIHFKTKSNNKQIIIYIYIYVYVCGKSQGMCAYPGGTWQMIWFKTKKQKPYHGQKVTNATNDFVFVAAE